MIANSDGPGMAYRVTPALFTTTFRFEWTSPPLHLNQRWPHWAPKAKVTREVRSMMQALARNIPDMTRIDVHLIWYVNDKRRRDGINLTPTLKALVDGLVSAEVIADDTPEFLSDHMPAIIYVNKLTDTAHFEFTVTELTA